MDHVTEVNDSNAGIAFDVDDEVSPVAIAVDGLGSQAAQVHQHSLEWVQRVAQQSPYSSGLHLRQYRQQ